VLEDFDSGVGGVVVDADDHGVGGAGGFEIWLLGLNRRDGKGCGGE
jgi:hypothetical protein